MPDGNFPALNVNPPQGFGGQGGALGMMGQMAQIQNQLNQSRQFQQQYQGRQALGQILQRSIDPDSGQVDWNKALVLGSMNPATGWMMPELLNQAAQRGLTNQETFNKALEARVKQADYVGNMYTGLAKKWGSPAGVSADDMHSSLTEAYSEGIFGTPGSPEAKQAYMSYVSNIPQTNNAIWNYAIQRGNMAMGAKESMGQVQQIINVGGRAQPVSISPEAAFTPQTGPLGPNNQPTMVTRQGLMGGAPITAPTNGGATTPMAAGNNGGGLAAATAGNAQPQPGGPLATASGVPAPRGPGGAYVTAPGPFGEGESKNMASYESDLNGRVSAGGDLMFRLNEMQSLLSQFKSGAGAGIYQKLGEIAQSLGAPNDIVDKISNGNLAATQEFQKFAVQSATEILKQIMSGAVGKITNLEFDQFQKNNPSIETDPRAITKIFSFLSRQYTRDSTEQQGLRRFVGQGGNSADWPMVWQQMQRQQGIINPGQFTGGGTLGTATSGVVAPGSTRRPLNEIFQ